MKKFKIGNWTVSKNSKTYFIADIAANHDGNLKRAKKLIRLCAKAGANAAKFQHFKAETIVSDQGFNRLGKITHQSKWKKSVLQVYKDASINFDWTKELQKECKKNKIDFLTSPYDLEYVDKVKKYVCSYKIGSGDITWLEIIDKISKKKLPVILATGAASLEEVKKAVKTILKNNKKLVVMQCNTNYTNSVENFKYINLNVINSYKKIFGNKIILGLSDHTPGHSTVLGAVTLGARVVEKHFTDDNSRTGPDHAFSMNFNTWKKMVDETRLLENALGDGIKKIEKNELQSCLVQKRAIYALKNIKKGENFKNKITVLRPAIKNYLAADKFAWLKNKSAKKNIKRGECINLRKVSF
jgi:sialic acid synthase SpsE